MLGIDTAARIAQAHDRGAGRTHIGVALAISAVRPGGHFPPLRRRRAVLRFRSSDGHHIRVVGRGEEMPGTAAVVAHSSHHHDAGLPRPLYCSIERIDRVGKGRVGAVRKVDDTDVQCRGVLDHPVDTGNHLGHVDGAGVVSHLHRHEPGVGRYAHEPLGMRCSKLGVGTRVATGDDAGHVCAMTKGIEELRSGRVRLGGEVDRRHHLVGARQGGHRGDTGVDEGHVHTFAGVPLRPHRACVDLIDHVVHRAVSQRHSGSRTTSSGHHYRGRRGRGTCRKRGRYSHDTRSDEGDR